MNAHGPEPAPAPRPAPAPGPPSSSSPSAPFLADLVVFDVDGTLQDTFQWWPRVIREGLSRFAARHGIAVTAPDDDAACAVVGLRDAAVWSPFLPPAAAHLWTALREVVIPLEVGELRSGRDYLFPGVRTLLARLRACGVRTALASNCRSAYFSAVCEGQGLAALTDLRFCLDSRGGCTKADMVRFAVEEAAAARPVMVGDRDTDLEAARAAGVPFVWRVNARNPVPDADARWHGDPAELLELLGVPALS